MPEIGATLREARMRARIDISEIESETKIRAKYLRALENEEWDLLPGPTYVKTFLRTYAEALGLDAKLLVEEYKLRHERLSEHDLRPIGPPGSARRAASRPPRGPLVPRGVLVGGVVVLLLVALFALGKLSGEEDAPTTASPPPAPSTTATAAAASSGTSKGGAAAPKRRPTSARLQITATGEVYVCLRAAGGRTLVDGQTLQAGQRTDVFRSSRFALVLGNNAVRLRIGSRTVDVPASDGPIAYSITRKGRAPLPEAQRPSCGA